MNIFLPNILAIPDGRPTPRRTILHTLLRSAARCVLFFGLVQVALARDPTVLWMHECDELRNTGIGKVLESGDGGFLIAGWTLPRDDHNIQALALKIDGLGRTIWYREYGSSDPDYFIDAVRADDGGYALAGSNSAGSSGVTKIDASGQIEWQFSSVGLGYMSCDKIVNLRGGDFAVPTQAHDFFNAKLMAALIRLRADGSVAWHRSYDRGRRIQTSFSSIRQTKDDGLIAVGTRIDLASTDSIATRALVNRVDGDGDEQWSWLGPDSLGYSSLVGLRRTCDSSFRSTGTCSPFLNDDDFPLDIHIDEDQGVNSVSLPAAWSPGMYICTEVDTGYVGFSQGRYDTIRIECYRLDYSEKWSVLIRRPGEFLEGAALLPLDNGEVLFGIRESGVRLLLGRLSSSDSLRWSPEQPLYPLMELGQNYPNPANASTSIRIWLSQPTDVKLTLFDILGRQTRVLYLGYMQAGESSIPVDIHDLPSAAYIYRLVGNHRAQARTLVVLR